MNTRASYAGDDNDWGRVMVIMRKLSYYLQNEKQKLPNKLEVPPVLIIDSKKLQLK